MSFDLLQQKGSPIRPPTPLTPTSNNTFSSTKFNTSSYSLFDWNDNLALNSSPWDWFSGSNTNTSLFRKHSINADDNDFPNISSPTSTTNFWRRASEPNTTGNIPAVCTSCLNKHTQLFTPSCGQHQFCNSCLTSQSLNLLMQGVCPTCSQVKKHFMYITESAQILINSPLFLHISFYTHRQ